MRNSQKKYALRKIAPAIASTFIEMKSSGAWTFKEMANGLGIAPSRITELVRAKRAFPEKYIIRLLQGGIMTTDQIMAGTPNLADHDAKYIRALAIFENTETRSAIIEAVIAGLDPVRILREAIGAINE